ADVVALYTSVLPRAMETAALIADGLPEGLSAVADCDLCELHPGEADGLTWRELVERFGAPGLDSDPDRPIAPGAESWRGFHERCARAFDDLVARHRGERVVLVVHGGVVESAMRRVLRAPVGVPLRLPTGNCAMSEVAVDDDGYRLVRYNDLAPLSA
ncbi:MAG: histidine phosphatase family protein, partial [Acidimicrobiales bacterium]